MNKFKLSILTALSFLSVGCSIKEEVISAPTAKYHIVEIKSLRGQEKPIMNKKGQNISQLMGVEKVEKTWRIGFFSGYQTEKTKEVEEKDLFMDCPGENTSCNIKPADNAFLIQNFGKIISISAGKSTDEISNLEKLEVGKTIRLLKDSMQLSNVQLKEPIAFINSVSRVGGVPLKVKLEVKMVKSCPAKIYKKEGKVLVDKSSSLPGYVVKSQAVWVEAVAECADE